MAYKHKKQREDVDIIRVVLWYEYVRQKLSLSSSDQIEKFFQPDKFVRYKNGEIGFPERWKLYQKGIHTPQPSFVQLVESHVSGSEDILNSVLWEAIRGRKTLSWYIKHGISQLTPEVQRVLFKSSDQLAHALSRGQLRRLERLAGLDALAAQVIFLRIADKRGDREKAFEIGLSVYRTLLIICTRILYFNLRRVLVVLMNLYVFPLAHEGLWRISVDDGRQFACEVMKIGNLLLAMEDRELIGDEPQDWNRAMSDLLDGKMGYSLRCAFMAPIAFRTKRDSDEFYKENINHKLKQWGWKLLENGKVERFFP